MSSAPTVCDERDTPQCPGLKADDTDEVDARAVGLHAEESIAKAPPGGPVKLGLGAVSPWDERVSTIDPLMAIPILTSWSVSVRIQRNRHRYKSAEDLNRCAVAQSGSTTTLCRKRRSITKHTSWT